MAFVFPTIKAPSRISYGGPYDPFLEDEFESGDGGGRPEFTAPRENPEVWSWGKLPRADLDALLTFRKTIRAAKFTLLHPSWKEVREYRFIGKGIPYDENGKYPDMFSVTMTIRREDT
jgi:hypothetical protein